MSQSTPAPGIIADASDRKVPAVVFDIGNVLIRWDPRFLYRTMFDDEAKMEWFLSTICTNAWNLEQDRGRPWDVATAELVALHPEWKDHIEAFDKRWVDTVGGPIEENVAVLRTLKAAGWPVYGITNFSQSKFEEACVIFPFLTLFDGVIVSGVEKLIKPDAAIYELFLTRFGHNASECVFLDDSAINVEGARNVGMHTIHVTPGLDIAEALRSHRVPL